MIPLAHPFIVNSPITGFDEIVGNLISGLEWFLAFFLIAMAIQVALFL